MSGMPSWNRPVMQLRVLRPSDDEVAGESERWRNLIRDDLTLCDYAEHCLIPDKLEGNRDAKTIQRIRDALKWWKRLLLDPPMARISDRDTNDFKRFLSRQKGRKGKTLALETVRQTLVRLRFVMREAAKAHVIDGRRVTFMDTVPHFELPRKTKTDPVPYTYEELKRILSHCDVMAWPEISGISAPRFWRALFVYLYYEGSRIEETLRLEYRDLVGETLTVRDETAKHDKGRSIDLHPEAAAALESIRTNRQFIFELPRGWERDMDKVKRECKRLLRAAGLYVPWRVFHGVRKTAGSEAARQGGMKAAQNLLNHTDERTTDAYVSREAQREYNLQVKQSLPRLPKLSDARQLRLPFGD